VRRKVWRDRGSRTCPSGAEDGRGGSTFLNVSAASRHHSNTSERRWYVARSVRSVVVCDCARVCGCRDTRTWSARACPIKANPRKGKTRAQFPLCARPRGIGRAVLVLVIAVLVVVYHRGTCLANVDSPATSTVRNKWPRVCACAKRISPIIPFLFRSVYTRQERISST